MKTEDPVPRPFFARRNRTDDLLDSNRRLDTPSPDLITSVGEVPLDVKQKLPGTRAILVAPLG